MRKLPFTILLLTSTVLTSCGGWTEKDDEDFMMTCESQMKNEGYCNCALEKAKAAFGSYEEMTHPDNQSEMANILTSEACYEAAEAEKE